MIHENALQVTGVAILLMGCQGQGPAATLEAALADGVWHVIEDHDFAAPELIVVDTAAAFLNVDLLASALELPVGPITRDCNPGGCVISPLVVAFLSLDRLHDGAGGEKVFTLTYHSNPPPYGPDTYAITHEYVMVQAETGWRVGETIETGEH